MRAALALVGLVGGLGVARADLRKPLVVVPSRFEHDAVQRAEKVALPGVTIYLNRCAAGACQVKPGPDAPESDISELVTAAVSLAPRDWKTGEWEGIVKCVQEVYSPYDAHVTDVRPSNGGYSEIIVAGSSETLGVQPSCGIASVFTGCQPRAGAVGFTFVDSGCYDGYRQFDPDPSSPDTGIWAMCAIIAQESAHALGLDHAFGMFLSGQSTCNDPMTYSVACGGEKFFRNDFAPCNGNDGKPKPACGFAQECGTKQNAHLQLLTALGPGTPITTPPMTTLNAPADGATVSAGAAVIATSGAQRGIASVELWINGYRWASVGGVAFGLHGQPTAAYTLNLPADVPDSLLDITVKAFDDIGAEGDAATITVTKGKAGGCNPSVTNADGSVDTCAIGQTCAAGKCAWTDANTGVFGDACTYPQKCTTDFQCAGTDTQKICTHTCDTTIADSCPMGFACATTGSGTGGVCFFPSDDGGGCCSTGSNGMPAAMLSIATLGIVLRRRRKVH